jgi:organic radical activating enzyme
MVNIVTYEKDFFCPAPWDQLYYHVNSASPCHLIRQTKLTPSEYFKSDWLRDLKQNFIDSKIPEPCMLCKKREDLGLKSTRGMMYKNLGNGERIIDKDLYTQESKHDTFRLEIRSSNLCNFKCRMCDAESSSEIAKEQNIPYVNYSTENVVEELKKITLDSVRIVCFTGGEPMLIKQYYEFMDLLIDKKLNDKTRIELFTNCSVYNPLFMERLVQFKKIGFVMSIDAVGKTAEYIRNGTIWETVEKNIFKFTEMFNTDLQNLYFNTAISSYVLLDVSSLAKFLMKLYSINKNIQTKCYTVIGPDHLHFLNLNSELRKKAINEIDMAINILNVENFDIFTKELKGIKKQLEIAPPRNELNFIKYTLILDKKRNESFENVFGYKLY